MTSHPGSSHCLQADDFQPSSYPAVSSATEANDVESPFIAKITASSNSTWFSDVTDLVVLLCFFLFITASIVFSIIAVYSAITSAPGPHTHLWILQRVLATVSVSITTAMMMVIGKRYVLFKLAREGLRSRRVAIYSNASIGNLASHLVLHGMARELPLLGLTAVWGLALVTSLTVTDTWYYGPGSHWMYPPILSGPVNPGNASSSSSYLLSAATKFTTVLSPFCEDSISYLPIQITSNADSSTDYPPMIYYPALPMGKSGRDIAFSYPTTMNGFSISMETLPAIPSTSKILTCTNTITFGKLWLAGSDDQTLSIIAVTETSIFRFNATVLIVGGTLSSTGNYAEFALNGTSWPNVMTGTQWAQDITTLICNATCPSDCGQTTTGDSGCPLFNEDLSYGPADELVHQMVSSALNMALGAYSSAVLPIVVGKEKIAITIYYDVFTTRYGIYILAANIFVSIIMLLIALRLRLASPLSSDFINSTRLLLDPLKKPELFNASLDETVKALADPYMRVRDNSVFLLAKGKLAKHRRGWRSSFGPEEQVELAIQSEDY